MGGGVGIVGRSNPLIMLCYGEKKTMPIYQKKDTYQLVKRSDRARQIIDSELGLMSPGERTKGSYQVILNRLSFLPGWWKQ